MNIRNIFYTGDWQPYRHDDELGVLRRWRVRAAPAALIVLETNGVDHPVDGAPSTTTPRRSRGTFSNFALQALVGPVFDKIASNLVEAFVKRAEQVYGGA
jgi:hypothetical protein